MKNSKLLLKHAFILDVLCLLLCFALLFLGNKNLIPYWMLATGAAIALVALVTSIVLFVKARKIDREESRRIEREILNNAASEDGGEIKDDKDSTPDTHTESTTEQEDYKTDEEEQ